MKTRSERSARVAGALVAGAMVGSVLVWLVRRRHLPQTARQRAIAKGRHAWRAASRKGRTTMMLGLGRAKGEWHHLRPPAAKPLDDAGLAHRVESVLFRDRAVPKRAISINAERGTVFLRGQVETAGLIDEIGVAVAHIPGVRRVVNLLHVPGTDAPHPPATAKAA